MDELARQGFDVWGLDCLGYGRADRYPEMYEPAATHPPLGRAEVAGVQIAAAVAYIRAARWLHDALRAASVKRDVKIDRGTHVMHLEVTRRELYREVTAFLSASDR